MNNEILYTQWTHQLRNVPVPGDFSQTVMVKVKDRNPNVPFQLFDRLNPRPCLLARWATALGLIALGIFRIAFVTANLLLGSAL